VKLTRFLIPLFAILGALAVTVPAYAQGSAAIPPERQVLVMYYGLGGDEPMTLKQIGNAFGVSRERVRQLRERALGRLRSEKARQLFQESAA
jgi:DNA-directed RNA polymerase specialized sigma24 family protein